MLILLSILLFILIPIAMLIFYLARPKLSVQGFLAILAVLVGLSMVIIAKPEVPHLIPLLKWQPESLFPISPALLIDHTSWYFALALASLSLTVVVTSITQYGQNTMLVGESVHKIIPVQELPNNPTKGKYSDEPVLLTEAGFSPSWLSWASILVLTSLSLLAVTAGNLLTLLLAWAALDFTELILSISLILQSRIRERIILAFSAKLAGIVTLLIAGFFVWSKSGSLSFEVIAPAISPYLILAAGLRLGVLPLHLPFPQGLPIRRALGTALRLLPAAASYILLVRVSTVGVEGSVVPYLLGFTILAGLFSTINWLGSKDELSGRPYWLLATASLAVAMALLNLPSACLAWSIASLLSGGLIFSMSLRHRKLIPIVILGIIILSSLPFSPTWQGIILYGFSSSLTINLPLFYLSAFFLLLIQSFLLAGFTHHALRGIYPAVEESVNQVERWVWFLYPVGLIIIILTHLFIGWLMHPILSDVPLAGWILGPVILIVSGFILYVYWRYPRSFPRIKPSSKTSFLTTLFSLNWLYRLLWKLFRIISRVFATFSRVLEGDGGILWAIVLFALIFVFLQR